MWLSRSAPVPRQDGEQGMEQALRRTISLVPLKIFVETSLSKDCILRQVILADSDQLQVHEFISRVRLWLELAKRSGV